MKITCSASAGFGALLLATTLAACTSPAASMSVSSARSTATPIASSTTTGPPEAETYNTIEQLRDAFTSAGGSCLTWEQSDLVTSAAQSGTCDDANVLMTFADDASKAKTVSNLKIFASAETPTTLLVGPNWIINDPSAPGLAEYLGGTVVTSTGN